MNAILFHNARLFDGEAEHLRENVSVLVEGERVREVSERPIASATAERIDLKGKTLMPGLIDAHFLFGPRHHADRRPWRFPGTCEREFGALRLCGVKHDGLGGRRTRRGAQG